MREVTDKSGQPLSEIETRAWHLLNERRGMRGSDLGWELWGETCESATRGEGSHRGNKFCRSAGKLLKRLERKGRAFWRPAESCSLWYAC